ncbi:CDP-alcohol phosphatidyltransferase family protein [Chelativorans alearense]|uniref:CDP-alcohol phosphatidyltransferase family protein n=1 Tax=Chelativorans alearense TaxID=2681495 RepID=UPI0013D382E6|nr:CDP-alcohol phosphatidyltransferase family protein [Chelativorans alearense]
MIDGWGKRRLEPVLAALAARLAAVGVSPNAATALSLMAGLSAGAAIATGHFWTGLALIILSRLGDGLDGALARIRGSTDFGGYIDIVFDFAYYGIIPLGFVLYDPGANGVAGAFLLFAFYVNGASFLAYAVLAEKRRMKTLERGEKSFFFTTGLAEAGETLIAFALACLFPRWFPLIAYVFAAITLYTAAARVVLAGKVFR